MRSARTGKYHGSGHHCMGGGRTPRPRLLHTPRIVRGSDRKAQEATSRNTQDNWPARFAGTLPCRLPRHRRGPLIDPERVTERLLQRDSFVPSATQNILAVAWPAFYRRVVRPARNGDKPQDWWTGPALLQILFAQEHNVIYRQLTAAYPRLHNDRLHAEARNISLALLQKIHLQWRANLVPAGDWFRPLQRLQYFTQAHRGIKRSSPSSVDRLLTCINLLLPDRFDIYSAVTGTRLGPAGGFGFVALCDPRAREFIERHDAVNLWYSFGIGTAGAFQLRNHCTASRRLPVRNSERFDNLVAQAIKHHRSSHPASYNALRRLLGLAPVREFSDLDPNCAASIEKCYSRVDDIDVLIGMLAEPRGKNRAIGESALRCLTLFDKVNQHCELSALGETWLRENSLKTLLLRHYPVLQDALYRIDDPFAHWRPVHSITGLES